MTSSGCRSWLLRRIPAALAMIPLIAFVSSPTGLLIVSQSMLAAWLYIRKDQW